jgi:hypothetical protein
MRLHDRVLGLSLYLILVVVEGYGIGFSIFDSRNSSITDTSSFYSLNYKQGNQTYQLPKNY